MPLSRREFLTALMGFVALTTGTRWAIAGKGHMRIYKDPLCGCCESWAEAMRRAAYAVDVHNEADMAAIKRRFAVPADLEACHTAVIEGYVIEGHVPPEAIGKLMDERPAIAGLAVPGMPEGSIGMGDSPNASYDVYAFGKSEATPRLFYQVRPRA
ncbi:DUF411 domain-containing protein (plasmid) [Sinorhizobium medicae]|uniref:DUF411 domain-containing protein n=1 Tax=Sinorhizobium medicae TaxID=110321 RepID=UPI002AF6BD84|nr:DUF411 domain-containing protein [Sinorhizobium medicae]WQO69331.1 DUF411 domain-containing protein [Sinorhizobium medicae]WQO95636.1 DUF411 domain-containing protein [Sinorhizobium medicae]